MKLVIEFDLDDPENHTPLAILEQVTVIMQQQMRHPHPQPFNPETFDSRALEKHGEFILVEGGDKRLARVSARALISNEAFNTVPRADIINDPGTKRVITKRVRN